MRIKILQILIVGLFIIVAFDLVYIQLIRGPFYYRLSTQNRIRVVPLEGKRGQILDRNGVVLADNRVSFDVMIIPQEMINKDELFMFLSEVLQAKPEKVLQTFNRKRYAPFAPVTIAEDITREQAFMLEENRFKFPSLIIQENFRRQYPYNNIGSHVLGYVGKINRAKIEKLKDYGYSMQGMTGYSGIEEYYDSDLRGDEGGLQVEVNSRGQQVRVLGVKEPRQGQDLQLTIDHRIQTIASQVLQDQAGSIVVMDLDSGEVLGMVSSPFYDPNVFADAKKWREASDLFSDKRSPTLNRAIQGLYPPGSVFKVPIAIGALETGTITPENSFVCNGSFKMGRRMMRCSHVHGTQNLIEGITHSCNVYFINVGLKLESELIAKYAHLFDLGRKANVDLPFEESGFIPSALEVKMKFNRPWYRGDTANLSIGQGDILITPIQIMRMMATVANNGRMPNPHLVLRKGDEGVIALSPEKTVKIDQKVLDIVKDGLYRVVHDPTGTAHVLDIPGLSISGKTGTAQSSPTKKHHAWFAGFTQEGKRKIAFCVFLEYGGSSYYACRAAFDLLSEMKKQEIL